jgi:spermidine/putrescine-binding protein
MAVVIMANGKVAEGICVRWPTWLAAFLTFSLSVFSIPSRAAEVVLLTWEEIFSPEVVSEFEAETGHTVYQLYFDDEAARDRLLLRGAHRAIDLVIMDSLTMGLFAGEGRLQPLGKFSEPSVSGIDDYWQELCAPHGMAFMWGTMGIAYRASISSEPVTSWLDLFEPAPEHAGRIVAHLDALDTVATALIAVGEDPYTESIPALQKAADLLASFAPNVLAWDYSITYIAESEDPERMTMALTFGDTMKSIIRDTGHADWRYVVPEEGSPIWVECLVSPVGRELSESTLQFLEFMSRPEIVARNAMQSYYGLVSQQAEKLTSDEFRSDEYINPPRSVINSGYPYRIVGAEGMRYRNRLVYRLSNPREGRQ